MRLGQRVQSEPVFLRVRWEARWPGGRIATLEATLCRSHRDDIWNLSSNVRGLGELGYSCDFCEGRRPTFSTPRQH